MSELHLKIMKTLNKNGFDAFLIGGSVRDLQLGIEPKDFDVVTSANIDEMLVYLKPKFKLKDINAHFKIVIVEDGDEKVEVAAYRSEASFGLGHKEFEVQAAESLLEDVQRRDFTINTLAMDLDGNIIDHMGGLKDLKNRVIRFVGNPDDRIKEDPLRMIRACRFASKIDGLFSESTFKAIVNNSNLIKTVPPERIRLEILSAMKTKKASKFFNTLRETGLLVHIFPELEKGYNHDHGKHHIETVWEHCMLVGDAISTRFPLLKLTGYLHDIGKPEAFIINKGENFVKHANIGEAIAEENLRKLKFFNDEILFITKLIRCHMKEYGRRSSSVRKFLSCLHDRNVNVSDWLRLTIADRRGNLKRSPYTITERKNMVKRLITELNNPQAAFSIKDLKITGEDVMRIKGIKPGREVGRILQRLLTFVIGNPEVNTKERLESTVRKVNFR